MEKTPDLVDLVSKFQKDIPESDTVQMVTLEVAGSLVLNGGTPVEGGSGHCGEVAPALVTDANVLYLEAIRLFGNKEGTVSDVPPHRADRGHRRGRTGDD